MKELTKHKRKLAGSIKKRFDKFYEKTGVYPIAAKVRLVNVSNVEDTNTIFNIVGIDIDLNLV